MLRFFHAETFPCCTFLCSNLFILHIFYVSPFLCCTICSIVALSSSAFLYCTISCCTFRHYNVFVLHSFAVALFACCNFSCCTLFIFRSSRSQMFFKKGILKNLAIFTGKHLCWSLPLIKKTPSQVFPREYCEIFKNSFFYKTPLVGASPSCTISRGIAMTLPNI